MSKTSEKYIIAKLEEKEHECNRLATRLRECKEESDAFRMQLDKCAIVFKMIANSDSTEIMDGTNNVYIGSMWVKPGDENYDLMKKMIKSFKEEKEKVKEDAKS